MKATLLCPHYGTASCSGSRRLHPLLKLHLTASKKLLTSLSFSTTERRRKVKAVRKQEKNITVVFFTNRSQYHPSSRTQKAWSVG